MSRCVEISLKSNSDPAAFLTIHAFRGYINTPENGV